MSRTLNPIAVLSFTQDKIKKYYLEEAMRWNERDEPCKASCEVDRFNNLLFITYKNEEGEIHKDPERGPAVIRWDYNQGLLVQEYRWEGKLHRLRGPAIYTQSPFREREVFKYYFHGKEYSREHHKLVCKGEFIDGGLGRVFL